MRVGARDTFIISHRRYYVNLYPSRPFALHQHNTCFVLCVLCTDSNSMLRAHTANTVSFLIHQSISLHSCTHSATYPVETSMCTHSTAHTRYNRIEIIYSWRVELGFWSPPVVCVYVAFRKLFSRSRSTEVYVRKFHGYSVQFSVGLC